MLREQLKNPGGGKRVRLEDTNSIQHHPTTVPTEIKVGDGDLKAKHHSLKGLYHLWHVVSFSDPVDSPLEFL